MMKLPTRFGEFGGVFVPEILVPALEELEAGFLAAQGDPAFQAELKELLKNYAGRPTPLYRCRNLPETGPARLYLKREDLLHGGAHKTNQVLGQGLLARRLLCQGRPSPRRWLGRTRLGRHLRRGPRPGQTQGTLHLKPRTLGPET